VSPVGVPPPDRLRILAPDVLAGQTALVTGAGTGIGRAVALRLTELGATVLGIGRRPEPLAGTAAQVADAGFPGRFLPFPADVRDPNITELVAELGRQYGLQIVVNNAGGQFVAPAAQLSPRGFASVLDLNLTAVARLTRAAHPWLAAAGGCVVTISLSDPERGIAGIAHSAAARAGTLGMTRELAAAWREQGIRVNCLAPGTVLTEGVRHELPPEVLAEVVGRTPLGRDTRPEEVAELVAFLATDAGALITGQMLALDGGSALVGAAGALQS
jgi:citronellol/citronellal dehydrogenase